LVFFAPVDDHFVFPVHVLLLDFQSVPEHEIADLLDLICLGLGALGLNIHDFIEVGHREDVVVAPDPLLEAQTAEDLAKPFKRDIRVSSL
jgi:hypothetical protein